MKVTTRKTWGKIFNMDNDPIEDDLLRFEDAEKPAEREVTLQDIVDFILKQPDERVVCMGDAMWRTDALFNKLKGHGCLMVHFGTEVLGLREDFNCGNREWYRLKNAHGEPVHGSVEKVFAKIKNEHQFRGTNCRQEEASSVWDVAYGIKNLGRGYLPVATDLNYWPFEAITYGELKDNLLEKYYDAEKDTHKPTRNLA